MKRLPKVLETSTGLVHYCAPTGLDQATICGITDWLEEKAPQPSTNKPVTCNGCKAIAHHFGYREKGTKP